jgi:hypothetical protein
VENLGAWTTCCKERLPELTPHEKRRLSVLAEIAADHGDDLDGFAAFLDDFGDRLGPGTTAGRRPGRLLEQRDPTAGAAGPFPG